MSTETLIRCDACGADVVAGRRLRRYDDFKVGTETFERGILWADRQHSTNRADFCDACYVLAVEAYLRLLKASR